jgi:hypothetical protein
MNENTSPSSRPSAMIVNAAVRWATSILWIVLVVALVLLVALVFASRFVGGEIITGCVAALGAVASVLLIRRLPFKNFGRLAAGYTLLLFVLYYFAHDDSALRQPPRIAPAMSDSPGAKESYAVLMRYGKQQALSHAFRPPIPSGAQSAAGRWKPADPEWRTWITANRAEIESGWNKLEPVRSWWAELNAFAHVADLTPPRSDADIPAFQPVRAVYQHGCGIASLHAIDGNEAAAIDTLLPILELSRKLQPASRTLVRSMIGIAGEKMALETAAFILNTTSVSAENRERLAKALHKNIPPAEAARRLVTMEYEWVAAALSSPDIRDFPVGESLPRWTHHAVPHVAPIIYNPRRTLNLYGDMVVQMQERAGNRVTADIDALTAVSLEIPRFGYKNIAGLALLKIITPNYNKILETHWKSEDLRLALQQRLQS